MKKDKPLTVRIIEKIIEKCLKGYHLAKNPVRKKVEPTSLEEMRDILNPKRKAKEGEENDIGKS